MSNKNLFPVFIIIILVLVGVGVWLGVSFGRSAGGGASPYSAVYLTTGDIYFGKLSWFPNPRLTNVWLPQRNVDSLNQPQLGLTPLTSAFWGPVDEIYLSPKQIVFWTRLSKASAVAKAFDNPALLQGLPQGGLPQVSTTTPR